MNRPVSYTHLLRYSRSSQETGIGKGEYARVKSVDAPNNRLTVERKSGEDCLLYTSRCV